MKHLLITIVVAASSCATISVSMGGSVAAEARAFVQTPRYAGQEDGNTVSLVTEPALRVDVSEGTHVFKLTPFYRLDPRDEQRSRADLREASYRLAVGSFELTFGSSIVSWGALEVHRPSDIVNQHDFVESLSESVKLGQPMLELGWVGESWSLKALALPYFRERTFPGTRGRLRGPVSIDVNHPQFESRFGRWQPSGALRFALNAGDFDLGLSAFTGLSREPRFIVEFTEGELVPRYDLLQQAAADAQWTFGALTVKAEAFIRLWTQQWIPFGGGGLGLDYTFFHFVGDADVTLAVEGYYDSRPIDAPITFYDHDLFGGLRFAMNDVGNLEVTAGVLIDVFSYATMARLEVSRRFGDHWRAYLSGHVFGFGQSTLQGAFSSDSYGQVRVAYFF